MPVSSDPLPPRPRASWSPIVHRLLHSVLALAHGYANSYNYNYNYNYYNSTTL